MSTKKTTAKKADKKPEEKLSQKVLDTKKLADDFEKKETLPVKPVKKKSVKKAKKTKGPKISLVENDPNVFQVIVDGANIGSVKTYERHANGPLAHNDCLSVISIAQDSHQGEVVILEGVIIGKLARKSGVSIAKKNGVEEILLDGKRIGTLTRDPKIGGF